MPRSGGKAYKPQLNPGTCPIQLLPADCLRCILFYLSDIDLTLVARVCKHWRNVSRSDSLWKPHLLSLQSDPKIQSPSPMWKIYRKTFLISHSDVVERVIDPSSGRVKASFNYETYPGPVGDALPCVHHLRVWRGPKMPESEITKRVKELHWRALTGTSQGSKERSNMVNQCKRRSATCRLNKCTKVSSLQTSSFLYNA